MKLSHLKAAMFALACGIATPSFAGIVNVDSAAHHYQLGRQAMEARKYNVAWLEFERATKHDPNNVKYYMEIASVCQEFLHKPAPAVEALEKAYSLQPTDMDVLLKLMNYYTFYGQGKKVLELGPKILKSNPKAKGIYFAMGEAYYKQQNYGQSLSMMTKAIKEDPNNAEAHYLSGRMLLNMANYNQAVKFYETALKLDNSKPVRAYEFAMLLATTSDFKRSIEWFEKTLELGYQPNDEFYKNMAYTYTDAKMSDKGINMLRDLLEKRPMDVLLLDGIADACYKAGRFKDAIGYWDRIFDIDANNARALYRIGLAYIKSGRNEEGKQYCDKAIAMDPSLEVLRHKMQ